MSSSAPDGQLPEPSSYEAASARIEEIVRRLDSGEAGLRETLELVAEGRRLVEWCAGELEAVGRGLEELRLEELVARLERSGEPER
jgi:exodeoxyribonuclease VII small subunit